jgi:hypothetical protein
MRIYAEDKENVKNNKLPELDKRSGNARRIAIVIAFVSVFVFIFKILFF